MKRSREKDTSSADEIKRQRMQPIEPKDLSKHKNFFLFEYEDYIHLVFPNKMSNAAFTALQKQLDHCKFDEIYLNFKSGSIEDHHQLLKFETSTVKTLRDCPIEIDKYPKIIEKIALLLLDAYELNLSLHNKFSSIFPSLLPIGLDEIIKVRDGIFKILPPYINEPRSFQEKLEILDPDYKTACAFREIQSDLLQPPESLLQEYKATEKSLAYSWASALIQIFKGDILIEKMKEISPGISKEERRISILSLLMEMSQSLPEEYKKIIQQCMEIDPAKRPGLSEIKKSFQTFKALMREANNHPFLSGSDHCRDLYNRALKNPLLYKTYTFSKNETLSIEGEPVPGRTNIYDTRFIAAAGPVEREDAERFIMNMTSDPKRKYLMDRIYKFLSCHDEIKKDSLKKDISELSAPLPFSDITNIMENLQMAEDNLITTEEAMRAIFEITGDKLDPVKLPISEVVAFSDCIYSFCDQEKNAKLGDFHDYGLDLKELISNPAFCITSEITKGQIEKSIYYPQIVMPKSLVQFTITIENKFDNTVQKINTVLFDVADGGFINLRKKNMDPALTEKEKQNLRNELIEALCQIYQKSRKSNILIHCKAGNGRTGHLLLIMRIVEKYSDIFNQNYDIPEILNKIDIIIDEMRDQRPGLILTKEQKLEAIYIAHVIHKYERKYGYSNAPESLEAVAKFPKSEVLVTYQNEQKELDRFAQIKIQEECQSQFPEDHTNRQKINTFITLMQSLCKTSCLTGQAIEELSLVLESFISDLAGPIKKSGEMLVPTWTFEDKEKVEDLKKFIAECNQKVRKKAEEKGMCLENMPIPIQFSDEKLENISKMQLALEKQLANRQGAYKDKKISFTADSINAQIFSFGARIFYNTLKWFLELSQKELPDPDTKNQYMVFLKYLQLTCPSMGALFAPLDDAALAEQYETQHALENADGMKHMDSMNARKASIEERVKNEIEQMGRNMPNNPETGKYFESLVNVMNQKPFGWTYQLIRLCVHTSSNEHISPKKVLEELDNLLAANTRTVGITELENLHHLKKFFQKVPNNCFDNKLELDRIKEIERYCIYKFYDVPKEDVDAFIEVQADELVDFKAGALRQLQYLSYLFNYSLEFTFDLIKKGEINSILFYEVAFKKELTKILPMFCHYEKEERQKPVDKPSNSNKWYPEGLNIGYETSQNPYRYPYGSQGMFPVYKPTQPTAPSRKEKPALKMVDLDIFTIFDECEIPDESRKILYSNALCNIMENSSVEFSEDLQRLAHELEKSHQSTLLAVLDIDNKEIHQVIVNCDKNLGTLLKLRADLHVLLTSEKETLDDAYESFLPMMDEGMNLDEEDEPFIPFEEEEDQAFVP